MPFARLDGRSLISVSGPDAEHFLQNILTLDVEAVLPGEVKPGALLTPQGKILFDFLLSRKDADFDLEVRSDVAGDFMRRLALYKLRAKVTLDQAEAVVRVSWNEPAEDNALRDMRFPDANVFRYHENAADAGDEKAWNAFRISHGVGESGSDYALGEAFPHEVLLDQNGGVGFKKGCYVGQEVVSRMQHRGTARRRILLAEAASSLSAGATITANGKAVGALGSVADTKGLATVRIDRVKEAMDNNVPVMAGDVPLRLSIPSWARFTFPESVASADEN